MKYIYFCLLLLITISNFPLTQEISDNPERRVTDSAGIPLPGVNIILQSERLQGVQDTITNYECENSINSNHMFFKKNN